MGRHLSSRICSIPKCGRKHRGRGYCNKHLLKFQKYGNPLKRAKTKHQIIMLWLKSNSFYEGDDCLIWPFSKDPAGYGQCRWNGMRGAHRVMCYISHGKPPTPKHEAAHSCRPRACVNPNHLSWKTAKENRADKIRDDTHLRGERNHKAKLTEANVRTIRKLRGKVTGRALAARYGVTPALISRIYMKQAWWWLE